jgi:hypothetical protein
MASRSSPDLTEAGDADGTVADQLLRGIIVAGILLATPPLVFHVMVPLVVSNVLGVFVAIPLLVMMGVGIYTIAEGELPSLARS